MALVTHMLDDAWTHVHSLIGPWTSHAGSGSAGAAAALQPITEHAPKVGMAMIRAISERVLMGGDEAADEDALYAETPARWKPSAAEIAHLDVCTLGAEGCTPACAGKCMLSVTQVPPSI